MKQIEVGPFTVHALTAGEGFDLLPLVGSNDGAAFQKALLLKSVKKDGASVESISFAEIIPHMGKLMEVAMDLNGFRGEPTEPV